MYLYLLPFSHLLLSNAFYLFVIFYLFPLSFLPLLHGKHFPHPCFSFFVPLSNFYLLFFTYLPTYIYCLPISSVLTSYRSSSLQILVTVRWAFLDRERNSLLFVRSFNCLC
jgi:hypothetical protein